MKIIRLHCGAEVMVDDSDFDRLSKHTWFLSNKGYAIASTHKDGKIVNLYMHRVVSEAPKGKQIDHRDGNRLNNTSENLRVCTATENNMNLAKRKDCSSVFKGVHWNRAREVWQARIKLNGKAKYLGAFKSEIDAGAAYNAAAKLIFGEFARLNPI